MVSVVWTIFKDPTVRYEALLEGFFGGDVKRSLGGGERQIGFSDDRFAQWKKTGENTRSAGFHVDF